MRKRFALIFVLLAAGCAFLYHTPTVRAQDSTYTLSWEDLGLGTRLRFRGAIISQEIFVPIPQGLHPQNIQGQLHISPDVTSGFLEIRSRERLLVTYDLKAPPPEITIPLADVPIENGYLPLTFIVRLRSEDSICIGDYIGRWLEITDIAVHFQGTPQPPKTVGSFLPSVLHHLYIAVPQNPTPAEAQAAFTLTTALGRKYHAPGLRVSLLTLDDQGHILDFPTDASPLFSRFIALQETETPEGHLQIRTSKDGKHPVLWVTGSADALETQSRWLINEWSQAAQAPSVSHAVDMSSPQEIGRDIILLDALQPPGWTVEGLGQLDIPIYFSQADLGGTVKDIVLHLAGTYTPLHPNSQATLSIYFNGGLVRSQILGQGGSFDLRIPLPSLLLRRDNNLTIRFFYTPPNGNCPLSAHPFAATIDKGSYLAVALGESAATGFDRYPQALLPTFVVALDPLDTDTLQAALTLIGEWQRLTRRRLHPQLVSWDKAIAASQPALLITRQAQQAQALHAPVRTEPFSVLDANGNEIFRFDLPTKLAVAEAYRQHQRDIFLIVAPSPLQPSQVADAALRYPRGWYGIQGDTLVVPSDGEPVTLDIQGKGVRVKPLSTETQAWWRRWLPALYIGGILLILLAAAWLYPRLVRPGIKSSDKQSN